MNEKIKETLVAYTIAYDEYIKRVKNACICIDSKTNIAAVNSDYKHILRENALTPERCEEKLSYGDILEILKLEVDAWNKWESNISKIINMFISNLNDEIIEDIKNKIIREKAKQSAEQKEINDTLEKLGFPHN